MDKLGRQRQVDVSGEAISELLSRLESRTAHVGVIGLGYVGLPVALLFANSGFPTSGFDTDPSKVDTLLKGESYIHHIPVENIARAVAEKRFHPTADFSQLGSMDAILVCVPTPLDEHRDPDLSYVRTTADQLSSSLRPGQLVVLESTTYPGTTDEVVLPILRQSGLRCPVSPYETDGLTVKGPGAPEADFLLAYSPERVDPGNKLYPAHQIPKVIGGVNPSSALAAQILYGNAFEQTVLVSSSKVAEMTKLLENIYRCVNIALVNELKLLCQRMEIDIWEVIEAAETKPFGFAPFYPGPGPGGHCIPIDPFYLTWKAREYDFPTRLVELAGEISSAMPMHVVETVAEALNRRRQSTQGAKVLILGVAYKKDVDDLRESPALRIIQQLWARGFQVDYYDPHFPHLPKTRRYDLRMSSIELSPERLTEYDAVVIVTDHSSLDYEEVVRHARLVVDTRNATRTVRENREKIVRC